MAAAILLLGGALALIQGWRERGRVPGTSPHSASAPEAAVEAGAGPILLMVAPVLSLGAGAIHLAAFPAHRDEIGALALGFLGAGVFQVGWAAAFLRPRRRLRSLGIAANVAMIGAWVVSRTAGLPIGPEAGVPEAVGLADGITVGLEIALVAFLVLTAAPRWRCRGHQDPAALKSVMVAIPAIGLVLIITLIGTAAALDIHRHGASPIGPSGSDWHHGAG